MIMGLNKENKDYFYNLGRTVALVEIMRGLPKTFISRVFDNAFANLPYNLSKALVMDSHNLHAELLGPANVVLMQGELPHGILTAYDPSGRYTIGYYHEMAYLDDKYKGAFGKVENVVEHHTPERLDAMVDDNSIGELRR